MTNYIIIVVNAVLIYVNAAGMNTVTRQSPFEGAGVKTELTTIKETQIEAGLFNLQSQKNWYPDYKMVKYVDTLKSEIFNLNEQKRHLLDEVSYLKDKIYNISKDSITSTQIKDFLKDFGRHVDDTTSFAIMKSEYKFLIDSIKRKLDFRERYPITQTTYYTIGNKEIPAEAYVDTLHRENSRAVSVINILLNNSKLSNGELDSILKAYRFRN